MNGWELTTFDSSKGANAARADRKECRPRTTAKMTAEKNDSREKDGGVNDGREKQFYLSPLAECAKQES